MDMAISYVGGTTQTQPAQQTGPTGSLPQAVAEQAGRASLPQDRVEISDAAQAGESDRQAAGETDSDARQAAQQAPLRRQTLYPGQKGYVAPSILSQFDSTGRALRGTGSTVDIQA